VFNATYNVNTLSTSPRKVVAEHSKLRVYFTASNFTSVEYQAYLVRGTAVTSLNYKGSFTNDVPSSFVGLDLSDPATYQKNDIVVIKFIVLDAKGNSSLRDVRVLIGDQSSSLSVLNTIPSF
jgi:hypothetical protein